MDRISWNRCSTRVARNERLCVAERSQTWWIRCSSHVQMIIIEAVKSNKCTWVLKTWNGKIGSLRPMDTVHSIAAANAISHWMHTWMQRIMPSYRLWCIWCSHRKCRNLAVPQPNSVQFLCYIFSTIRMWIWRSIEIWWSRVAAATRPTTWTLGWAMLSDQCCCNWNRIQDDAIIYQLRSLDDVRNLIAEFSCVNFVYVLYL